MVLTVKRKRDEFQAYYTHCDFITNYMVSLLDCYDGMTILEPCAGDGAFIDELIRKCKRLRIIGYEVKSYSVAQLYQKYKNVNQVTIAEADFMFFEDNKRYDRVIANPPYGAYLTPQKRVEIKKRFPDIYVKETYGVFLVKALEMLKPNGRLVFIIPDTFLTIHMHEGLRRKLLNNYTVESITLFPSNFFPHVNFGYAGLSIIVVQNQKAPDGWSFPVYGDLQSPKDLELLLSEQKEKYKSTMLSYDAIKKKPALSFHISKDICVESIFGSNTKTIGDICDVVTGFYSGNDKQYLRRASVVNRGVGKYAEVEDEFIFHTSEINKPSLDGIDDPIHWVPIVKGGKKRFYKPSEWFMNWSKDAVYDYKVVNKKRARFQNSQFYFQQGLAVPMVSSSRITCSLMDFRLFDQSIVGIFPKAEYSHLLMFLLGFFNSKICNIFIRTINSSSNNSANYIKKLPIIIPNQTQINEITNIVELLLAKAKNEDVIESELRILDTLFFELFKIEHM